MITDICVFLQEQRAKARRSACLASPAVSQSPEHSAEQREASLHCEYQGHYNILVLLTETTCEISWCCDRLREHCEDDARLLCKTQTA